MFTLCTLQVSSVLTRLVIWLLFQAVCCERSLPQACWLCPFSLWKRGLRFIRGKTFSYLAESLFIIIKMIWDVFYLCIFVASFCMKCEFCGIVWLCSHSWWCVLLFVDEIYSQLCWKLAGSPEILAFYSLSIHLRWYDFLFSAKHKHNFFYRNVCHYMSIYRCIHWIHAPDQS